MYGTDNYYSSNVECRMQVKNRTTTGIFVAPAVVDDEYRRSPQVMPYVMLNALNILDTEYGLWTVDDIACRSLQFTSCKL